MKLCHCHTHFAQKYASSSPCISSVMPSVSCHRAISVAPADDRPFLLPHHRRQGELRIAVRWVLSSRDDKPLIAARSPPVLRAPTPGSQATGVLPQPRIITLTRGKYGFGMNVSLDCRVDSYPPPPFEAFVGFVPSLPLLAHSQRMLFLSFCLSVSSSSASLSGIV